jgi:hypothetical protein
MLTTIRVLRIFVGLIAVWQVIGLLPVLTNWLPNLQNVTGSMWAIAFVKSLVMLLCGGIYFWLGKVKSRIDSSGKSTSEGRFIIFAVLALLAIGVILAIAIPVLSDRGQETASVSALQDQSYDSAEIVGLYYPESIAQPLAGEWRCIRERSTQAKRMILHPDGSVSASTEGLGTLIKDPWLRWYVPTEVVTPDQSHYLRFKRDSINSIYATYPNGKIDRCVR